MKRKTTTKNSRLNNRGAALITVVIAMLFIIALGSALLFSAYSGAAVKAAERGDRRNFYTAEEAMDELRAELQSYMSDILSKSYTDALIAYAEDVDGVDPQALFAVKTWDGLTETNPALISTSGTPNYNLGTLRNLLGDKDGITLGVNGEFDAANITNADRRIICVDAEGATVPIISGEPDGIIATITLKNVSVRSIHEGYEALVNTDLVLTIPDFYAKAITAAKFTDYSIMTEGTFVVEAGQTVTVHGDIYAADGITVETGGELIITPSSDAPSSNVICGGDIVLQDGAKFKYEAPDFELWAQNIVVNGAKGVNGEEGNECKLELNGNVYLADDLEINGFGADITLKGGFVGFGSSSTDMEASSSIVVNGKEAELDMSMLDALSLAGVSFIYDTDRTTTEGGVQGFEVGTGQSLTVKTDQLAYLVPAECIADCATNPFVFESRAAAQAAIAEVGFPEVDLSLCRLNSGKTLNEYTGTSGYTVHYEQTPEGDPVIMYVFMKFPDTASASAYFKDYLSGSADNIAQYLDTYFAEDGLSLPDSASSAGVLYYFDENDNDALKAMQTGGTGGANSAGFRAKIYKSKTSSCEKLITGIMDRFRAIRASTNPVYSQARGFTNKNVTPNVYAVATIPDGNVYNGKELNDYTYNFDNRSEKFIICADADPNDNIRSRVIIASRCECIVVAERDIIASGLSTVITGSYNDDVFEAWNNGDATNSLRFGDILGKDYGTAPSSDDPWAPEYLVTYKNWKKN